MAACPSRSWRSSNAPLNAHGLIKVRINDDDRVARAAIIDAMAARTDAAIVHKVGKIVVLWRPTPEEQAPGFGS